MKCRNIFRWAVWVCFFAALAAYGQTPADQPAPVDAGVQTRIPRLIKFSGTILGPEGKPLAGLIDVTFSLYKEDNGGSPLWYETQTTEADASGRYTVLLGAMTPAGVPVELFISGEAHWLGVQVSNLPEPPRILLVSVPYAMKAGDADTLGGKPPSAYVAVSGDSSQAEKEVPAGTTSTETTGVATSGSKAPAKDALTAQTVPENGPANFSGVTGDQVVRITQTGGGLALSASATGNNAIVGTMAGSSGAFSGLKGITHSSEGAGVSGVVTATGGWAINGYASAPTGFTVGIQGVNDSSSGTALSGWARAATGATIGMVGSAASTGGTGLVGKATAVSGATKGILAQVSSPSGIGITINNLAGGKLFSGQNNSVEKISFDANGNISAASAALTAVPTGTLVNQGTLFLNPPSATLNYTVLGLAVGGVEKFKVDAEGDVAGRGGVFGGQVQIGVVGTGSSSGGSIGVKGVSDSSGGTAVRGDAGATSGQTFGVHGVDSADDGTGVFGVNNSSAAAAGIYGIGPHGVRGEATNSPIGIGVYGRGGAVGIRGEVRADAAVAGLFDKYVSSFTPSGNIILARWGTFGLSSEDVFRVDATGTVYADGSFNCGLGAGCFNTGAGADVAERIDSSESLEPGDVVGIDIDHPGQFKKVRAPFSTLVAGIVSTAPSITLANNDLKDNDAGVRRDRRPLLALVGRVPLKVTDQGGAIRVGDLLTSSSTPGHAMRCRNKELCAGAVVGKALQPLASGTGIIQALVTLQ